MKSFFLIRYLLAGSTTRSVQNLQRLSHNRDSRLRRRVAENNICPHELLVLLAKDKQADVRMAVALNLHIDLQTQIALSKDENPDVRFRIASTSYIPVSVLKKLADDENPYVQSRAMITLNSLTLQNLKQEQEAV